MRFSDTNLLAALDAWRHDPAVPERARADNMEFEEKVSAPRLAAFESLARGVVTTDDLRRRQTDYYKTFVETGDEVPSTFSSELEPADIGSKLIDEYQFILRIENLTRPLNKWDLDFNELMAAFSRKDVPVLREFLNVWNNSNVRDNRPAFAAWEDQLLDELDAPDWPELLRDRMGLAHYGSPVPPIPVALMRYSVREVRAEATSKGVETMFTCPTVLDSGPWEYFFPAPAELVCGRAMALSLLRDENRLLAEMLHFRLTYKPDHIARLGWIGTPAAVADMKELRNLHLTAVRLASGRYDFGEDIP